MSSRGRSPGRPSPPRETAAVSNHPFLCRTRAKRSIPRETNESGRTRGRVTRTDPFVSDREVACRRKGLFLRARAGPAPPPPVTPSSLDHGPAPSESGYLSPPQRLPGSYSHTHTRASQRTHAFFRSDIRPSRTLRPLARLDSRNFCPVLFFSGPFFLRIFELRTARASVLRAYLATGVRGRGRLDLGLLSPRARIKLVGDSRQ